MSGIGQLTVTQGDATVAAWMIHEGGGILASLNGNEFTFSLDRAPLPSGFDIREMSSAAIAKALLNKLEDEATEREQEALEQSYCD